MSSRTCFWSSSLADDWEHGLVAGTGSVGAVLSGTPGRHVIHVCHEEFFLPVNAAKRAPRIAPGLADVRAAALAGDTDAAAAISDRLAREDGYHGTFVWTDPFTSIAELSWTPDAAGQTTDYRRTGDFETGRVEVGWTDADGASTRIALVPDRASNGMAVQLVSDGDRTGILGLSLGDDAPGIDAPFSTDYSVFLHPARPEVSGTTLALDVRVDEAALPPFVHENPPSPWAPRHVRLLVDLPDDTPFDVVEGGVRLHLRAGRSVHLPIRIELTGGLAPAAAPDGTLARVSAPEGATHASLFGASSLDLHSGIDDELSYDEVLERARAGDAQAVLSAVELAFAAGRHTIISSTGVLPPTLVGIWQGTRRPAWSGDWTQNGNVQHGGVASLVASGTPELFTSYLRAIFRHVDDYAANAERVFGALGWMLPARFSSHGNANHFAADYPHHFWLAGGAWVLRMAWDQFAVTGDVATLREYAWPLAQNVMSFAMGVAFSSDDGSLHVAPSYSPENSPSNRTNPIAVDATMDIAAFRDAARLAIRIADVLGEDADREGWRTFADALPPYRIAEDGTLAEWLDGTIAEQMAHRHVSQLYPFWYEDDEAAASPELREAARQTIHRKLAWREEKPWAPPRGRSEMAFGLVGLGLAAARLGDAEAARRCVESLARDYWRPNAVSTHDGDAIFNVDASGGLPAIVIEMLVQSGPGTLRLLPALPSSWPSGSIRGVRARGGVIVEDLAWGPDGASATLRTAPSSTAARNDDLVSVTGPDGVARTIDLASDVVTLRWPTPA